MKTSHSRFLSAFLFFLAVLAGAGFFQFNREQKRTDEQIHQTLERSILTAAHFVGNNYHERVLAHPPGKEEDMVMIRTLSSLAQEQGVKYIYSMILDKEGKLRFTSSSATSEELRTGKNLTRFFDPYEEYASMVHVLKSGKPYLDLDETTDQWGQFRSLYIPYTTPSGKRYLIGADIEISQIRHLSSIAFYKATLYSFVPFAAILPLLFIYRQSVRQTTEYLQHKVAEATDALRKANKKLESRVQEKTRELIAQSYTDALTGLPNRFQIAEDLMQKPFYALLILDLNGFREINDLFGVRIGDDLILQVGRWLKDQNRHVYRLGGDEFVILLDKPVNEEMIEKQCQKMLNALALYPFMIAEESVTLRMTIGVDTSETLSLAHADIALHDAKERGTHIAFYKSEDGVETRYKHNIALSSSIHNALREGRIVCHYQPIVSIASNRIEKYESLVRMIDENDQVVPPGEFLYIAQKTRLYSKITQEVVRNACATFAHRSEEFSVNLSIRDISDPATIDFIEQTITETRTAERIVFEILESEGIENFETVAAFIRRMKQKGAKIAIDDYGSGYSSLENMLRLEIDYLKIDGSIIRNIDTDPKYLLAAESIAQFSAKLGIKTIAEFVSSQSIYDHVQTIGITYAQGYHIGKPKPLSTHMDTNS